MENLFGCVYNFSAYTYFYFRHRVECVALQIRYQLPEAWAREEARQREGVAEAAQLAQEALVVATDAASRGAEQLLSAPLPKEGSRRVSRGILHTQ